MAVLLALGFILTTPYVVSYLYTSARQRIYPYVKIYLAHVAEPTPVHLDGNVYKLTYHHDGNRHDLYFPIRTIDVPTNVAITPWMTYLLIQQRGVPLLISHEDLSPNSTLIPYSPDDE